MALINKIREKSGLTFGIVAIALISFLVGGDLLSPNSALMGSNPTDVGFVNGTEIDYPTMQREIDNIVNQNKVQTGENPTPAQLASFQNDAWNRIMFNFGYKPDFTNLGIKVTKEERDDMLAGKNIHPSLKQSFMDPATQQFSQEQLIQYIRIFDGTNPPEGMNPQDFMFRKSAWEMFKNQIPEDRLQNKYVNLLSKSSFVTTKEAEKGYISSATQANIKYVYVPYFSLADSTIEISDKDLNAYLKSNSKKFPTEATRSFDYVLFSINATSEDTLLVRDELSEIAEDFKTTKNDTVFARQYSDDPQMPSKSTIAQLPIAVQSMSLDSGNVSPIVKEGNSLAVYKITNISEDSIFSVKASHILVKWDSESDDDKAKAKKEAKLLLDSLKRGSDFTQFAIMHSKDFGSGTRGGDLGWFSEGAMVPTFNDAVFAKSGTGLINEIVESQFGYHIIKVTEPKTNVSYTVAKITRNVYPSEDTKDVIYTKVSEFLTNVKTTEDFTAKVEANADVQKFSSGNLTSMDQFLRGVGNARPIVRWAFNEGELNKVSNILSVDNAYIVATITSVNPKGTAPLESVREEVAIKVRNAKKATQIASKLDATKSLEDIAASYGENISVRTANALNLTSSSIDGIGFDPKAVGASFVLANGDKSSVIEGENGVLIIEMVAKTEPSPKEDFSFEKASLLSKVQSKTNGLVFQALKDLLDIEDNRVRYY